MSKKEVFIRSWARMSLVITDWLRDRVLSESPAKKEEATE
jgi:hypothetical protein